jgi:hypothetical protein
LRIRRTHHILKIDPGLLLRNALRPAHKALWRDVAGNRMLIVIYRVYQTENNNRPAQKVRPVLKYSREN